MGDGHNVGTSRFSPGLRRGRNPEPVVGADDLASEAGNEVTPAENTTTPSGVTIRPDLGPPAAGAQPVDQPGSGMGLLVAIFASAIVLVLAIYATGQPRPNRIPILQTTNALFWIVGVLVIVGAGVGAQVAERLAARGSGLVRRSPDALPTAWIVPTVATAAAVLLVATFHNALMIAVGPVVAFLGNAGALLARDLLDDSGDSARRAAITVHAFVVHFVAFLALSAVYLNKLPTPVGVVLVALVGGVLTLESLERGNAPRERRILYAILGGFVVAQAIIPLNWWQTHGWTGGAILLVVFYLAAGVLLASTQRALRTRDLLEFGLVGALCFVALVFTA